MTPTSQPQGFMPLSPLARKLGFTHAWNWGRASVKPIDAISQKSTLGTALNASLGVGPGGRCVSFTGVVNDRIEVTGDPFATAVGTYLWVESGVDATPLTGQALTNSKYGSSPAGEVGGFQIRLIAGDVTVIKAQTAVLVTATGARKDTGKVNAGAVSSAGTSARIAVFGNGALIATGTGSSSYTHGTSCIAGGSDCAMGSIKIYELIFAPVVIPDAILTDLTANPWKLWTAPSRRLFAPPSVAGAIIANPIRGAFSPTQGYFS